MTKHQDDGDIQQIGSRDDERTKGTSQPHSLRRETPGHAQTDLEHDQKSAKVLGDIRYKRLNFHKESHSVVIVYPDSSSRGVLINILH